MKSPRHRCTSEIFHTMRACSGLRHTLSTTRIVNIDAAMTVSMFMGSLSFAVMTEDFQVALADRAVPFCWLGKQLGLKSLSTLFQAGQGAQTVWHDIYKDAVGGFLQVDDERPGIDGIPKELLTLFDVTQSSSCDDHPYLRGLRRLCHILCIDSQDPLAHLQYMQFVEVITPIFLCLLNGLDTKVLVLVSYWLALLCTKDCWWSRLRAKNDCWAICEHLQRHGDDTLWRYMDFPALACGYTYSGTAPAGQQLIERLRRDCYQGAAVSSFSTC